MPTPSQILLEFIFPALLVAVGMALAWWPRAGKHGRWLTPLAISAGFILADCGISGTPTWPPGSGDAAYWIIWFSIAAAIAGSLDALFPIPLWPRATLVWTLSRIFLGLLLAPLSKNPALAPAQAAIDSMALLATVWWITWTTLASRQPGTLTPLLITIFLAASGGIYALANDIKPSQAIVALFGIGIAVVVAAWLWPSLSLDRGGITAFIIPLLGMMALVHYYYYTEPPAAAVAVLLASPLLAFTADAPPANKLSPRSRFALRVASVVIGVGLALCLSAHEFLKPAQSAPGHSTVQPADE